MPPRRLPPDTDLVAWLRALKPAERRRAIELLGEAERDALDRAWPEWAHRGQRADGEGWRTWVIMAGRGFGKTFAGAQWVTAAVATRERLKIALVGATLDETRRIMVEGKSGLIEVAGAWVADWSPSLRRLRFRTGAEATLFSGASPDQLRGPEHHLAWCDELAKWEKPQECWDMLQLGLRLGPHPQALVTTTPRPGPVLRAIMADPGTIVTGGPTRANPHVSIAWKRAVERIYAGTRLGRQELEGELLADAAGALWWPELLEGCRIDPPRDGEVAARSADGGGLERVADPPPPFACGEWSPSPSRGGPILAFTRIVIAVDPPAGDGTCGIVACAEDKEGKAHVLADHSVTARTPEGWARAVADAAKLHALPPLPFGERAGPARASAWEGEGLIPIEIVAESNQGGKMVRTILHTADPNLKVKLVTAHHGKTARAEPVAQLFEAGRVLLHGRFPELEAQLCGMIAGGGYEGPGKSPDRADAMVWGLAELMLGREPSESRVRTL